MSPYGTHLQVHQYPGYWGGVSGTIEKEDSSPLEAARRELHEECGVAPEDTHVVMAGRPQPVDDGDRSFLVFPFLLKAHGDPQVTLNWENSGYTWGGRV